MFVLFTDLDGTLLDHSTYDWKPARPAIERLRREGIPWIFTTSKTRAEVEPLRRELGNEHPFIVENGGAAFVPDAGEPGGYRILEWGVRYPELLRALAEASRAAGCPVRGFHDMTAEEVAAACNLPVETAELAKQRDYDEPFVIQTEPCAPALCGAIERAGYGWTRGGRFWHIFGNCDKAKAVIAVADLYRQDGVEVKTVGLGDSFNDVPFLREVEIPVVMLSKSASALRAELPHALSSSQAGPEGWNEIVLEIIDGGT